MPHSNPLARNRAIRLLEDHPGGGERLIRGQVYLMRLRLWLNQGQPVRRSLPAGLVDRARLEDDGTTQVSDLRYDRESLFPGLFKGVAGMRVGGSRRLRVSPHLAYGRRGVPGHIPPNAALEVEVTVIEKRRG